MFISAFFFLKIDDLQILFTIAVATNETCICHLEKFPENTQIIKMRTTNISFIVGSPTMLFFKEHIAIQIYLGSGVSFSNNLY
jgi:hypothetical protein